MIYLNTYRPQPVPTSTISLLDFVFPVYFIMVLFGVCVCMYVHASACVYVCLYVCVCGGGDQA